MPITTPVWVALALWLGSFFMKGDRPIRAERTEFRLGHAIANNSDFQPSGFQLTEALPSLDIPLTKPFGPSWGRARIRWNPELELGMFWVPNVRPLFGLRLLQFKYELEPVHGWSLYGISGWGGLYSHIERPETGSDGNFSLVIGGGIRYAATPSTSYLVEYRHLHISNFGSDDQNNGIDSHTFLLGISRRL